MYTVILRAPENSEYPEGAYCDLSLMRQERMYPLEVRTLRSGGYLWANPKFTGTVLNTVEQNGYHDSDFYFRYWNEETQSVEDVMYDTTRFGSTWFALTEDATPAVRERVRTFYEERKQRQLQIEQQHQQRQADDAGISMEVYENLYNVLGAEKGNAVVGLLQAYKRGKMRSSFRISLAKQVLAWAEGKSEYRAPLSKNQLNYL